MPSQDNAFTRAKTSRWVTENAARFVRPDAARFYTPGTKLEEVFPALALKYSPDQPRVPAGNPDSGQWTDADGGWGDAQAQAEAAKLATDRRVMLAARSRNTADCDLQYRKETFICNAVRLRSCCARAAERYAACLAGQPIPPLNF